MVSKSAHSRSLAEALPGAIIRRANWDEPGPTRLRQLAVEELCMRYETDSVGEEPNPTKLYKQLVISLVNEAINIDIACVALMDVTGEHPDFSGPVLEIKRVFVHPDYRGLGLSRHLMNRVTEEAYTFARENDLTSLQLILETGTKQPEAMSLYSSLGYEQIKNYGEWQDDPLSRCYELPLVF